MLMLISLVIESVSIVVCIHRICGKRVRFNFKAIVVVILHVLMMTIINCLKISHIATVLIYVIYFIYCKVEFEEQFIKAGLHVLLLSVIITSLQFICIFCTSIIITDNERIVMILCDIEVLLFCIFILPKFQMDIVRKKIFLRKKYLISVLGFSGIVISFLLLQGKLFREVWIEFFVFSIPAVLMLIVIISEWNSSQGKLEQVERELDNNIRLQEKYGELLKKVRLRQHEFKNHLMAILLTHYTYKTYEKLIKAQREYLGMLALENKYNGLLTIGNETLAGYLYGKFQELEESGAHVEYHIRTKLGGMKTPNFYLIEILGVLLDNAAEAYEDSALEKTIIFSITETEGRYFFRIQNRHDYVPYSEVERWFRMGVSTKGAERGLGLYHVRQLCEEWKMEIRCENIEDEKENWIRFTLITERADNRE